jgi:hypothetical protein
MAFPDHYGKFVLLDPVTGQPDLGSESNPLHVTGIELAGDVSIDAVGVKNAGGVQVNPARKEDVDALTAAVSDLAAALGAIDDSAVIDPDADGSLISLSKGALQEALAVAAALSGVGTETTQLLNKAALLAIQAALEGTLSVEAVVTDILSSSYLSDSIGKAPIVGYILADNGSGGLGAYAVAAKTIASSSSGNTKLLDAVSNRKHMVLGGRLSANAAVNVKFQETASGGGSAADIEGSGLWYFGDKGGAVFNSPEGGYEFKTSAVNKELHVNLSTGVAVGGRVIYAQVPA